MERVPFNPNNLAGKSSKKGASMFDGARGDWRRSMRGRDEMQVDFHEEEKKGGVKRRN
jgi:hypothetical protein